MSQSYIIAAARIVDGQGSLAEVESIWEDLKRKGACLTEFSIDPLETGWHAPLEPNHFRSGCGPIEALAHADTLVREGEADAVLIRGEDRLRSRYAQDKQFRQQQMAIYGADCPLPEAYTRLAHAFMRQHGVSSTQFKQLAGALYENYVRTARGCGNYQPPRPDAFNQVTELFRAVDCANPVIDFAGAVIVTRGDILPAAPKIAVKGVGLGQTGADGPDHVEEIAAYRHLTRAYQDACSQSGINLTDEFLAGRALLEAYTCFPVAPLGFLLASGIAKEIGEIPSLLANHEITVTGGMNIARAPWNNPSLNALIVMHQQLRTGSAQFGAIHGNGGLGYRQGVAILGAV